MTYWPFSRGLLKNIHKIIVEYESQLLKNYSKITQKFLKNYSKITQKLLNIWNNDIAAASDHAVLRVSVIQWNLEVILSTIQHNKCSYNFWDSYQQEVS